MKGLLLAGMICALAIPAQGCTFSGSLAPFQVLDTATGTLSAVADAEFRSGGPCGLAVPLHDLEGDLLAYRSWDGGVVALNLSTGRRVASGSSTQAIAGMSAPLSARVDLSVAGGKVYVLGGPGAAVAVFDAATQAQSSIAWPFPSSRNGTAGLGGPVLYWFPWAPDGWYRDVWAYDLVAGRMLVAGRTIQELGAPAGVRELSWLGDPGADSLGGTRSGILFFQRTANADPSLGEPVNRHWLYVPGDGRMHALEWSTRGQYHGSDAGGRFFAWGGGPWLASAGLGGDQAALPMPDALSGLEPVFGAAWGSRIVVSHQANRLPDGAPVSESGGQRTAPAPSPAALLGLVALATVATLRRRRPSHPLAAGA